MKILSLNPQYGGATHDAFIWRNSQINDFLREKYQLGDHSTWLIGDSGYPLQPWLMTPIADAPEQSPEGRYNRAHISARNAIERCNGVLKARFRCLNNERGLRYDPNMVGKIITVCAVLHNMCIEYRVDDNLHFIPEPNEPDLQVLHPVPQDLLNEGRRIRNNIINRYFRI